MKYGDGVIKMKRKRGRKKVAGTYLKKNDKEIARCTLNENNW